MPRTTRPRRSAAAILVTAVVTSVLALGASAAHAQTFTSPATGSHDVGGAILSTYRALGGPAGKLGYPVTDQACGLPGGGCYLHFQGGSVYTSPGYGSHAVSGRIRDAWAASGWERGPLGYPVEGARSVPGGQAQRFQGGLLTLDQGSGQVRRS